MHQRRLLSILGLVGGVALVTPPGGADEACSKQTAQPWAVRMERLEEQVSAAPDNLDLRVRLIVEYHLRRSFANARAARVPHLLWMIEHAPRHGITGVPYGKLSRQVNPEAYERASRLWHAHLEQHGNDIEILDHAIVFFLPDDPETADELVRRAVQLQPWSPRRQQQQERLRAFREWRSSPQAAAIRAVAPPDAHAAGAPGEDVIRYHQLPELADQALRTGQIAWASSDAQELLELAERLLPDWNYGNAIHEGHRVLGHAALEQSDIARAKQHLLAAGTTPGSPQLRSIGPDLSLAQALLAKGERAAVVQYLGLCSRFWPQGEAVLKIWVAAIEEGQTPDLDRFRVATRRP